MSERSYKAGYYLGATATDAATIGTLFAVAAAVVTGGLPAITTIMIAAGIGAFVGLARSVAQRESANSLFGSTLHDIRDGAGYGFKGGLYHGFLSNIPVGTLYHLIRYQSLNF